MMMILTLLLTLAVLVLFMDSSYARPDKNRVEISEGRRRSRGSERSRGKSGNFKSKGKRSDNHKSYSAQPNFALSVEDDEEEDDRLQHSQNAHADQNHVVGLESIDSRFSFEDKSMRLNLEGGAWKSQKADGSVEYMAFENKYTYIKVLRQASGEYTCGKHIYDQRHKNKNPSILYSSYFSLIKVSLIHKRTDNMFVQKFVYNNLNVSWTREESIPSDFRCYTASVVIAAEGIGEELDRDHLTWMGQNIGLYAAVEMDQDYDGSLTVISELDGYTKTVIPDILPQYSQFRYVVASYNNTFWTICHCGDNNELMQSNSITPISFDFEIGGATALSESVLLLADDTNARIVKYDVVNNEILATTSGYIEARDLAISLDKKYVYYLARKDPIFLFALNTNDLSFYCSYLLIIPEKERRWELGIVGIEVTPSHMWVVIQDPNVYQSFLASITLNH